MSRRNWIMAERVPKKTSLRTQSLRLLTLCASVALLVTSPRAGAQTPTPVNKCGNVSGAVVVTADLTATNGKCLVVSGDNTTIDGNHHTITVTGGYDNWAISDTHYNHLTVQNVVTDVGVYISGTSSNALVQYNTLGSVYVSTADDVTIDHNTIGSVSISGTSDDPPARAHLTNNTIVSDNQTIIDFDGGDVGPCPITNFVVTDNTITSNYRCTVKGDPTIVGQDVCDEPKVLFMRCGSGNTVSHNLLLSNGEAMPARFRDEFDNSMVNNNTFWATHAVDGGFCAFNITSGNLDKHPPQNNTFTRNLMRADDDSAMCLQYEGASNTFSYNTIWANSGGYAATVGGPANGVFTHNTFYNAGTGEALGMSYKDLGVDTFSNNIFDYQSSSAYSYDWWGTDRYQGNNNLFFNRGGSVGFGAYGATLAAWKVSVAPYDSASKEGDPKFTNSTTGDFSLQAGSPAINAAGDGTNIGVWQTGDCTSSWSCDPWQTCQDTNTQIRTCRDTNSCQPPTNQPALTQSCDGTAPTVSITAPTNTATISGTVSIAATASDNVSVVGVQFKLDGNDLGSEDTAAPYVVSWDTTKTTSTSHALTAVARDAAGHTTTASAVMVTVNNAVACVEDWTTIPCSGWSGCDALTHTQTRTCTDKNGCNTTVNQPTLSQQCAVIDVLPPMAVTDLRAL